MSARSTGCLYATTASVSSAACDSFESDRALDSLLSHVLYSGSVSIWNPAAISSIRKAAPAASYRSFSAAMCFLTSRASPAPTICAIFAAGSGTSEAKRIASTTLCVVISFGFAGVPLGCTTSVSLMIAEYIGSGRRRPHRNRPSVGLRTQRFSPASVDP